MLSTKTKAGRGVAAFLRAAALVLIGGLALSGASWADRGTTAFAGVQVDTSRVLYAGAIVPVTGDRDTNGFAIGGSAFAGMYEYDSGALGQIDADFYGAQVTAMYQYTGDKNWGSVGVGARFADTSLDPSDPGNDREGAQTELVVSVDGGTANGPWRADWYGSYGTSFEDYDGRISLTHSIGDGQWRAGGEFGVEGDPTYDIQRYGAYGARSFGDTEFQISAGYSQHSFGDSGAYVRAGFVRSF